MIKIKGINLPNDLIILFSTPFRVFKWRRKANKIGFAKILKSIERIEKGKSPDEQQLKRLYRHHKITMAYLNKIMKDPNPCLITSLILQEECKKWNIKATLVIGADKKDNSIIGHSWVEVNKKAINENDDQLKKYVRMTEI